MKKKNVDSASETVTPKSKLCQGLYWGNLQKEHVYHCMVFRSSNPVTYEKYTGSRTMHDTKSH